MCQQMGLVTNFADAKKAVETAVLDTKLKKGELVQAHNSKQSRSKGNKGGEPKAT